MEAKTRKSLLPFSRVVARPNRANRAPRPSSEAMRSCQNFTPKRSIFFAPLAMWQNGKSSQKLKGRGQSLVSNRAISPFHPQPDFSFFHLGPASGPRPGCRTKRRAGVKTDGYLSRCEATDRPKSDRVPRDHVTNGPAPAPAAPPHRSSRRPVAARQASPPAREVTPGPRPAWRSPPRSRLGLCLAAPAAGRVLPGRDCAGFAPPPPPTPRLL